MKVILEIDDKYANVLSLTAVGCSPLTAFVSTQVVDLSEHNHLVLGNDGKWTNGRPEDETENH